MLRCTVLPRLLLRRPIRALAPSLPRPHAPPFRPSKPQFENVTADETHAAVLKDLMVFLDLDPNQGPEVLPQANSRKDDVKSEGWPMMRHEYEDLLSYVRPLSER